MKTIGTRLVCILACWVFPSSILASVEVDGIFYELNTSAKTAAVTSNPDKYTGAIDIPSSFDYNGDTYNVKSISSLAFLNCSEMTTINFPSSVTSIGSSAFERCAGLTDVVIGSGVTLIDYEAFKNCSNLRSLTLPSSLKTIENETFSGCTSLVEIIAKRTTPPTIVNTTFDGVDKTACIVYVPDGCQSTYAKAANWKAFSNIIERTVVATGSCGDNVTYIIYSDKSMVISGTGPMCDFFIGVIEEGEIGGEDVTEVEYNTRVNDEYWSQIKNVTIEEGVTSIGEYAFSYCADLTSVSIPNSVTSIGAFSFINCTNLSSITIPSSVAVIGDCAFSFSGLTRFTIEDGNDGLLFGSSISSGIEFFEECPLEYVYMGRNIRTNNRTDATMEQLLRWGDSVTLPPFSGQGSLKTLVIGDNVTTLEDYSFSGAPLQSLVIGNNVQTIGMYALSSANKGQTITIPSNVTKVGECCLSPKISKLVIEKGDNDLELYGGTYSTYLSFFVDSWDSIVDSVYLGRKFTYNSPYSPLNRFVTAYLDVELTAIPETVEYDDEGNVVSVLSYKSAPFQATNLYFENDGAIGRYYFNESGIEHIYNLNPSKAGDHAFANCGVKTITFNVNGSASIAPNMFEGCRGLTSLTIPEGVQEIGHSSFENCIRLECVKIPNSVTTIGNGAFFNCKLSDFYVGSIPAQILETTFGFWGDEEDEEYQTEVEHTLHVPYGCKSAYEIAEYWDYFDNIVEDGGNLDVLASGSCGDMTYTIFSDMTMVISGKGTLKDFSTDFYTDYFESIKKVIIEDGVTSIGDYAFAYCSGLTSITMPNSVTAIGDHAFAGCEGLTSITIPNRLTTISAYAFAYCSGLTSITIPNSVTAINDHAFAYCDGLTSITIPNSVTTIGAYAFADCSGLSSVSKGDNISLIGFRAFYNTLWLDNQPDGLVYVGKVAYYFKGEMPKGEEIILRDGTLGISFGIFCDSGSPTIITIPSSLISIEPSLCYYIDYHYEGENIFGNVDYIKVDENNLLYDSRDNCNAIIEKSSNTLIAGSKNTIIPLGVTNIGPFTLGYMTSVTIPSSVNLIDGDAFYHHVIYVYGDDNQYRQRAMAGYSTALKSIFLEGSTPPDVTIDDRDDLIDYCVLYVPTGSKSVYESAKGWCAFRNIIEYEPDTDISTLDNAIYVERIEGRIGGTMNIPVKVKNSYDFRGFQFTMELPEGTTVNSWKLSANRLPSGATLSDKFSTQKIEGNKINVACSLNYGDATFSGNDGEIATVNVTFANDMEVGEYPIYLTACDISDAGGTDNKLSDIKATLVLEDYVEGDANGDGVVLIGDVIAILNYIVGVTSNNFNEKAADVNGDGEILIGDVIAVLNIIVSQ